jgi:hypothetical protein
LPGASIASGEGQYYVIAPSHCGLSFGVTGLPFGRRWSMNDLSTAPDSARVETILVLGACHVNGGLRILGDTTKTR